jgi:cytoskeletal protein CcmA (bactofilin family)
MTEISKSYTIRQYPPIALLDNGVLSDNDLTYTSSMTDGTDISGTQYGAGSYIVKYSSYKNTNSKPWIILKNDPAYWSKIDISSSQPNWAGNYNLVAPYSYLDNSYLVNNFTGDYITIKLPNKIYLTKYVICSTIDKIKKAPQHFSIYGSIDGVNWNKIVEKNLTPTSYINTPIPNSTYSTGYYTDDETKSSVAYDYYGIVVNKLIGPLDASDNNLSFSLWNVYGTNNLKEKSYFEFGVVTDTSKIIGSSLKDGLIKTNISNIFVKSGNTNTPALTIGTNNRVAIGKNIANEAFDVSGSIIVKEYRIKNQSYPVIDASSNIAASGNIDISGNLTLNNNKFVVNSSTGKLSVAGTLDISKNININNGKTIIDSSGNIKSQGNFDLSSNININNYVLVDTSGSVIMNNTLDISNNATFRNNLDIKGNFKSSALTTNSSLNKVSIRNTSVDPSYNFHVTGSTRLQGNLDVDGNIIIVDTLQQTAEQFIINNDGDTVALTVRQIGAQPIIDLRDDNKSVFYLADNGLLGLGTTTPSCTVDVSGSCFVQEILDVSGNLNISGNTYLPGNIQFNDILDVSRNLNINNKFFMDPSGNVDICGNMLIYGYLISNGNNANSGGFKQDGNAIINGNLRVLYNIDISQNLRVLDTFIVDTSGNIKSKGKFDLSNNLRNGSNYSINTVGNVYSSGNIDISKNFNINNGVFSADVSGNIIVNGFIDVSKNLYVNGNKCTIDQNGNITAMGNFDLSQNLTINTNKFIVDASGNIKSAGNLDISNNFNINNGAFKIDNNGNISSQNNFDISGNMSINGSKMTVSNTGNIKSAGTLDISNNFSINNDQFTVDSSGNIIAKGNIDISKNLSIGNNKFNVDVSGNIKSSGTLDISKNLKIGNTLLTVDHQNKRVGINTTTPEYSLDVSGQIITNKGIMGSTLDSSSNAAFGYRDADTTIIPSIVQLNTGQTYINSLSRYINFNFGNDNKCKMDASGNLILNGDIFIYSDERIKENVTTITSALDKVNELSGITYNIINKPRRQIGVVAQEVEKVLPEVIKEEEGVKTVAYPNMVGLLIEALKELNDRVDQTEKCV